MFSSFWAVVTTGAAWLVVSLSPICPILLRGNAPHGRGWSCCRHLFLLMSAGTTPACLGPPQTWVKGLGNTGSKPGRERRMGTPAGAARPAQRGGPWATGGRPVGRDDAAVLGISGPVQSVLRLDTISPHVPPQIPDAPAGTPARWPTPPRPTRPTDPPPPPARPRPPWQPQRPSVWRTVRRPAVRVRASAPHLWPSASRGGSPPPGRGPLRY